MQEEVVNRTIALSMNVSRVTTRTLLAAIRLVLAEMRRHRNQHPIVPHGKQTMKQLVGQGAGVSNIEITNDNIKSFECVARKYGVDFALMKERNGDKPKYLVFFKGRDADALTAAFTEYTRKVLQRNEKPSVLAQLNKYKELVKTRALDRVKSREPLLER